MINKVILLGNITENPEIKKSKSGKKCAYFSIALNAKDKTTYANCIAFEKNAELLQNYFAKGDFIGVTGRLDILKKNDKYYTNIMVSEISFAGYKKAEAEEATEDFPFDFDE